MKRVIAKYIFILQFICAIGCGGSSDSTNEDIIPNEPDTNLIEEKKTVFEGYVIPENNQTCTGKDLSENSIEVNFEWKNFSNVEFEKLNYSLEILDRSSNTIFSKIDTKDNFAKVTLEKSKSYSWSVTASNNNGVEVSGDFWFFSTPSFSEITSVPSSAKLISPSNGDFVNYRDFHIDDMVVLEWENNSKTPLTYDVYFDDKYPPHLEKQNVSELSFETTKGSSGITYYWQIASKDTNGNQTFSEIFTYSFIR